MSTADIIGFIGVSLLLLAFALSLRGVIKQNGWEYASINAIGAGVAAYASWLIDYIPFVLLEGTWCLVSLAALANWFRSATRP